MTVAASFGANAQRTLKGQTINGNCTFAAHSGAPVQLWSDLILAGVQVRIVVADDDSVGCVTA